MLNLYRSLIVCFFVFIFFIAIKSESWARAGRGGGYRGGGSSYRSSSSYSSRSYSSGSSYSSRSYGSSRRTGSSGEAPPMKYILAVFAILIIIGIIVKYFEEHSNKNMSSAIYENNLKQERALFNRKLQQIKVRDPGFDLRKLEERIKTSFINIQNAWSGNDMSSVRPFISDGIFERFSFQLQMYQTLNQRNIMRDVSVKDIECIAVECDEFYDSLHFKIKASAIDYIEDIKKNKVIFGSKSKSEDFDEYWSFIRKPGAKTLNKSGAMEGSCPNCGQILKSLDKVTCESCQAIVNSGEYDWVLAEITQETAWNVPETGANIPGVEDLSAVDPGFNIQHIEDRTSVIFWRNIAADFFRDSGYIRKMATDEFIQENSARFEKTDSQHITFYADAAVGGVELQEVVRGDNGFDRCFVLVNWSGHRERIPANSTYLPDYDKSMFFQQIFVLKRKVNVMSSDSSFSSAHCPGCGASESVSTNGTCEYCGINLNDGSHSWVLEEIKRYSPGQNLKSTSIPALSVSKQATRADEEMFACAAAIMYADNELDFREEMELNKFALSRGISPGRIKMIMNTVKQSGAELTENLDPKQARNLLKLMIRICLADGKIVPEEEQMLDALAKHFGYADVDINMMMRYEQANMYSEARENLKKSHG